MSYPLPIVITSGEPAGIGPDLLISIAQQPLSYPVIVIADADLLQARAQHLRLPLHIHRIHSLHDKTISKQNTSPSLTVYHVPLAETSHCGKLNPANAQYVLQTLEIAAKGCLEKSLAGMVTGPVHKGNINAAGFRFTGHTEFLANITQAECPVMMLATGELRVALVTTHLPLSQVSAAITSEHLTKVIRVIHSDMQAQFHIKSPRITVCGLNPHAGEQGYLGREEITIIGPVLDALRKEGLQLTGPLPADTVFTPHSLKEADVIVAMYHDQGLPVVKHVGFSNAVNITLGLPIIRTSVDHGTALSLAGTGQADAGSLKAAINMAIELAKNSI